MFPYDILLIVFLLSILIASIANKNNYVSIPITGFFIYRYGFINVVMYGLITIFIEMLFVLLLIICLSKPNINDSNKKWA
jgi:hypothetical protein